MIFGFCIILFVLIFRFGCIGNSHGIPGRRDDGIRTFLHQNSKAVLATKTSNISISEEFFNFLIQGKIIGTDSKKLLQCFFFANVTLLSFKAYGQRKGFHNRAVSFEFRTWVNPAQGFWLMFLRIKNSLFLAFFLVSRSRYCG